MKFAAILLLTAVGWRCLATPPPAPDNDNFACRIVLNGVNIVTNGTNAGATSEPGEPNDSLAGGKSVWWSWTAPASGGLQLNTVGSNFDTLLSLYTGNTLSNLTLIVFNDEDPLGNTNVSRLDANVTQGTTYTIAVDGNLNATGNIVLHLTLGPALPTQPNDAFSNAIPISGDHLSNVTGSNVGATREPGEPFHADELGGKSVWWSWTAPDNGGVTLTTQGSTIDTLLGVYTGNSVDQLTFVAGNDEDPLSLQGFQSRVTFNAVSNTTYRIAVDGFDADEGDIRLRLDLGTAFSTPTNDNFADRLVLTGSSITTTGSNVNATFEPGEPEHLVTFGGKSVWWTWTAPVSAKVSLTASNTGVDTILAVYQGDALSNLVFVAGNDEDYTTAVDGDSSLSFNATAGTAYQIAVDGFDGSSGTFLLRLSLALADPVPLNDDFDHSVALSGGNISVSGSNVGATFEPDEPLHNSSYGGKSIWWRWTAPGPGYVGIDTIGSTCDTLLAVYTGTALSNLVEVASDDESGGNHTSLVTFETKDNAVYQIAVDGFDGDSGDISLHIHFAQASYSLILLTNPVAGGALSFTPLPDQNGKYAPGSVVQLNATPLNSYQFTGWTGNVLFATNTSYAVLMNANRTITGNFFLPPPRLAAAPAQSSQTILTNGFRILLSGPTNYSYAIERSSTLSTWTAFTTNLLLSSPLQVQDREATNVTRRWYRARRLP